MFVIAIITLLSWLEFLQPPFLCIDAVTCRQVRFLLPVVMNLKPLLLQKQKFCCFQIRHLCVFRLLSVLSVGRLKLWRSSETFTFYTWHKPLLNKVGKNATVWLRVDELVDWHFPLSTQLFCVDVGFKNETWYQTKPSWHFLCCFAKHKVSVSVLMCEKYFCGMSLLQMFVHAK